MAEIQNDLTQKFSKGTIIIHWLTAILILLLFPLGIYMEGLEPIDKMGLIKIHVLLGLIVFILSIFRSWLFFKAPRPDDLKTGSKFNDKLAVLIHNAFYFLLFLISLSGIGTLILGGYSDAIRTGAIDLIKSPEEIPPLTPHHLLAVTLMALLVMHVVGVIKHYLLTKENTLKRMF